MWPPQLAGTPLWEFYAIGSDGLATYLTPTHRMLCEVFPTRFSAKRHDSPSPVSRKAFPNFYLTEVGWYADDAVIAAEWLRERGAAVVDVELWLIANGAVQPHIHTASGPVAYHHWITTLPSETWEQFANRSLSEAKRFMHELNWPENAVEPIYQEPRFCLSWVWKEWLEEDGFKFPE